MKKIISLFLLMISIALPSIAQQSSGHTSDRPVSLEVRQTKGSGSRMHRAPMRINIEAYYNEVDGTLDICYDGEAVGEVYLYLNDTIVGYDSEINTSFPISSSDLYKIEIISETWVATGYIQL